MAKRCGTRICRKGHRPLWRILPSGTPTEPVPLRLPTEAEWEAERLSWGSNNMAGAFGSPLKFSLGGRRNFDNGAPFELNTSGYYWSSTVITTSARAILFFNANAILVSVLRATGYKVRLIIDGTFTQQQFDDHYSGKTILIAGLIYGYAYNATTTRIWLDRNLGASQVATSSTDSDSYGWLYQWGRLSDGHQLSTSSTTATFSITDVPTTSDFILGQMFANNGDWRNPGNDNLWQGVDGINNPAN